MSSEILLIIPVALAIAPSLLTLIFLCKTDFRKWILALIGGGGWFIALIARLGILALISKTIKEFLIVSVVSSVLAGIFEESTRYFIIKHIIREDELWSSKHLASLGLGWGFIEALMIYVSQALFAGFVLQVSWLSLIPGAIERNVAVFFHVALTFLVAYIVRRENVALMIAPITLHAVSNIYAVLVFNYVRNVWITEAFISFAIIPISALVILTTIPKRHVVP